MSSAIERVVANAGTNTGGTFNTSGINACYDHWIDRNPWYTSTIYPYYGNTQDKGLTALSIVKALMDKKLVKLTTIKQFVDLMDEIVKIL